MKVLFFHRWVGLHEGGTETEIKLLSSYLASKEHEVSLLTLPGKSVSELPLKVKKYFLKKLPGESDYSYDIRDPRLYLFTLFFMFQSLVWLTVSYFFYRRRFDLISVHFYTESVVARVFRALTGTPYVFVLEGYTKREAKEASFANKVFCISRHDQEQCFTDFGYRPILKPVGIDVGQWSGVEKDTNLRRIYASPDNTLCLTVCRLEPRKDLPTLINAARLVNRSSLSIKFLIVGEGISYLELKELVKELNLEKVVVFAGRVTDADLVKYYRIGDIFVLPTLYEGFGIVYLEAMASGLPIISTNVGAVPEVVGDCGVIIEPGNPEILSEAILKLSANNDEMKRYAENGRRRVKSEYDREKVMMIYENECTKLIK